MGGARSWSWQGGGSDMQNMVLGGGVSIAFEAARDLTNTTGQALEPNAWVGPTWQNHPAI